MINWEHDICDHGVKVGRYVAGISESQDQLSSLLSWNQAYIDRFISRIPDPLFPCAVLQQIGIFEKFENRGFGTLGIKHFLDVAIKKGCKMALTQVGFYGDPILEIKKKNIHFYEKTGWIPLFQDLETPFFYHPLKAEQDAAANP